MTVYHFRVASWWRQDGSAPRLVNTYGPTEGTVVSTLCDLLPRSTADESLRVPIGRPLAGVTAQVLDAELRPSPIGVGGELCLGGRGLARGYLGRPEPTAERFVPDPHSLNEGARIYRSGDLARFLADGTLEFLGRLDHQVKVRGFRIEPGEIEAALLDHPQVVDAAVVAVREESSADRLVGYVAAEAASPTEAPVEDGADAEGQLEAALRTWLRQQLPDYMVPAFLVRLDELPKTGSGKIDRRQLIGRGLPATTDRGADGAPVAARDDSEAALVEIWRGVLGLDAVSIDDNFFELGGDSILGIQIVAQAHQAGFELTLQQLFQHQTIAELATVIQHSPPIEAEQGPVVGAMPLTPYQSWFFDVLAPAEADHWNIALLLELRRDWQPEVLEQALGALLQHHDALRCRFPLADGELAQNAAPGELTPLHCMDLSALPETTWQPVLETSAAHYQASLDLAAGPLLRAVLFRPPGEQAPRLLLAVHHMVIDVVSWHILLEDLRTLCEQTVRREPQRLPRKSTSYKSWAEKLEEFARSPALDQEKDYWLRPLPEDLCELPADHPGGRNVEGAIETVFTSLSEDDTDALLHEVPKAYNTQINDALLAALATAFTRQLGGHGLAIDLEGHGREDLLPGVDMSRTIGCFTALFPIVLEMPDATDPGEVLRTVKEQLRGIPRHGVGYGVLRYLSTDQETRERLAQRPAAQASFNYLGQFDQTLPETSPFAVAPESTGPIRSPRAARGNPIEILAGVSAGKLEVRWIFSRELHQRSSIAALAERLGESLRELIEHCLSPEAESFTPSDFELAALNQNDLDDLMAQIREQVQ
ncbi:MAG: condensation domain-containing protein [Acidobacteriota bacterium]